MSNQLSLELIKQTCLKEEKITKNGQTQNVYVVVKNSPFQMVCGISENNFDVNFNKFNFDVKLMYDMDGDKEVSWVKTKPVECKPVINDEGDQISFDAIKIKVLSSHHEDNLFRLKLVVWDPMNQECEYTLLSNPIKVISKPLRNKSKKELKNDSILSSSPSSSSLNSPQRSNSKRSFSDISGPNDYLILEKIDSLLEGQRQTSKQIEHLQQFLSCYPSSMNGNNEKMHPNDISSFDRMDYNHQGISEMKGDPNENPFVSNFSKVIQSFSQMESNEAFENVRNLLKNTSAKDISKLVELVDILNAAGLNEIHNSLYSHNPFQNQLIPSDDSNHQLQNHHHHHHENGCNDQCPHKMELNRMEMFYSELFLD